MKYDLCIWAKNGGKVLPFSLKRIDEVIPHEVVGSKILADDHSTDETVKIAKEFNWTVYPNTFGGLAAGASLCLQKVKTPQFISFEQDVVLARNWFEKIPSYLEDPKVAVAQGWRISPHPVIGKIDLVNMTNPKNMKCSIDNNVYRTDVIKNVGIPSYCGGAVDSFVQEHVEKYGYKWIVDFSVVSEHLRLDGLKEMTRRLFMYGYTYPYDFSGRRLGSIIATVESPIRAFKIAVQKSCPLVVFYFPLMRLSQLNGTLCRGKTGRRRCARGVN